MTEQEIPLTELNQAEDIKALIVHRTSSLDTYIEQNSTRNLEFMKFEALERIKNYLAEYSNMLQIVDKIEEDYQNDPRILAMQSEVDWYNKRVEDFLKIKNSDEDLINDYKNTVNQCKLTNRLLESSLKNHKTQMVKGQFIINKTNKDNAVKGRDNINTGVPLKIEFNMTNKEKEQYEYLKGASDRIKKTLEEVRNEIQKYKNQEFYTRKQVLPVHDFFNECYKSVYHLIFQKQSQLDDNQLSMAYKMFRDTKMEYGDIVHRSHRNTSRFESYILRDALVKKQQFERKNKNSRHFEFEAYTWEDFKKLSAETVFIMISRKEILKALRQSLCSVNIKVVPKGGQKNSVEQFEEFCNFYADKLKIRTDERGSAI